MKYYLGPNELFPKDSAKVIQRITNYKKVIKYLGGFDSLAFDTETHGTDPYTANLLLYQIGTPEHQFVMDAASYPIELFKPLLETKELIMQAGKFDLKFLYHHRIVPCKVWDTFLAEQVLYTGIVTVRKSLAAIYLRRFNIVLDKTDRKKFIRGIIDTKSIIYAASDVERLHEIKELQIGDLRRAQLMRTAELENKFVRVLPYIEYSGIGFAPEPWLVKCAEDSKKLVKLRDKLDKYVLDKCDPKFTDITLFGTACKVKWSSPDQVVTLFKSLGITTLTQDKKTGESKDSVLSKLIDSQKSKFDILPIYLEYKKVEKLCSTFGETYLRYINPVTNRIHTEFQQIKDTGRLSCGRKGKTKRDPDYPNLQQVPGVLSGDVTFRHKRCFIPTHGCKMIIGDYASQESRLLVDLSKEPNLVKFYLSGEADLHAYTASLVYPELRSVPLEDIKKHHKAKRELMKKVNFGIAYGGTEITISLNANIPLEQAKAVFEAYFKAFPQLRAYFDYAREVPVNVGYVLINKVSGRKSFIPFYETFSKIQGIVSKPGFWDEYRENKEPHKDTVRTYFQMRGQIERKGLNYPIQGTSADMSKLAGVYFFEWLEKNKLLFKVWMPNIVHDELHAECKEALAERVRIALKDCMERAGNVFCKSIPIIADVGIADAWVK